MNFQADSVEYWSDQESTTVFFGNAAQELALTIATVAGAGGHCLEWNDQSNLCPNAVKRAQLSGRQLEIQLTAPASKRLGESKFLIELSCEDDLLSAVTERLQTILGERFQIKAPPRRPAKKVAAPAPAKDYSVIKYLNLEGKDLKTLPSYVASMAALETAKLARNPKLDLHSVCEVLANLPVKELTFTTDQPIPESLGALTQIESLSLDGFTTPKALPGTIGQLKKLKRVLIMGDAGVTLPDSFAACVELEDLRMRVPTWQIPARFDRFSKLTELDLSGCTVTRVPEEMAAMAAVTCVCFGSEPRDYAQIMPVVARMPNLERLEFSGNIIPKEVALCRQIQELVIWGDRYNSTGDLQLPEELFTLTQLKALLISFSRFTTVPAALSNLKELESLVFNECDFETLPDSIGDLSNLTLLNVSENPSLRALPETLGQLTKLQKLYVAENPKLTRLPDNLRHVADLRFSG